MKQKYKYTEPHGWVMNGTEYYMKDLNDTEYYTTCIRSFLECSQQATAFSFAWTISQNILFHHHACCCASLELHICTYSEKRGSDAPILRKK